MKRMVQWFAYCAATCVASAQGTLQVVVPSGHANVEGNSATTALFSNSPLKLLQVFSASEFGLPQGATGAITSLAFRFDGASGQIFNGGWPGLSVTLSTTPRSPDSLSPVFAENVGPDALNVFNNILLIRATNSGVSPRMFEVLIQFTRPFFYDPSRGNLSMEIITSSGPQSLVLDAQDSFGDGLGRVFGSQGGFNGTVDSLGIVTRFEITPVPEPNHASFFVLGLACVWLVRVLSRRASREGPF